MSDEIVESIKRDIHHMTLEVRDLKDGHKELINLMKQNALLEQKLNDSNAHHDEGRRVLHKRLDLFGKIAFWFGTTLFTGMIGIIFTLVQTILDKG